MFVPFREKRQESFTDVMEVKFGNAEHLIKTGFIMIPNSVVSMIFIIEDIGHLSKELESLYKRGKKSHYNGNYTRLMIRVLKLEKSQRFHDRMRWLIVPKYIQKKVNDNGLPNAEGLF